jgi:hypothetical protein
LENNGYTVTQLLNDQATKANIISTLTDIINQLSDGDKLFFSFSGHGSYIPCIDNSEIDGTTEILCPYDLINSDGTWNFENIITDDELFRIISKNPKIQVELLFDSCHSQGTSRSIMPNLLQRYVECPLSKDLINPTVTKRFNTVNDNTNIIEWSGCMSNQTSADAYINGNYQGAFSFHFFKHLGKSRQEMITNIQDDIKNSGFTQIPQLTCADSELLNNPF